MKRSVFFTLVSGLWILNSQFSYAILDTNNNGLSDVWERAHNNNQLFPNAYDLQADPDGDGWTNLQEAAAGTSPFNANTPGGFVQPIIIHFPAVYIAGPNGEQELLTPEAISINWRTKIGKLYTLQYSLDLSQDSWNPLGSSDRATNTETTTFVPLTQDDGTTPERMFWRVEISVLIVMKMALRTSRS